MIYLMKEHIEKFPTLSKETFRRLVKNYIHEQSDDVKLQIINLGAKLALKHKDDPKIQEISNYLFKVASFDRSSLIIRQKARMLSYLLSPDN